MSGSPGEESATKDAGPPDGSTASNPPSGRRLRVGAAIPAAGTGRRLGGGKKPFLELGGEPLLLHALRPLLEDPRVQAIAVALGPAEVRDPPPWLAAAVAGFPPVRVVGGGATRAHSVRAALAVLPVDLDVILVHDAARPLLDAAVLDRCVRAAGAGRSVVAGWPAVDTLKEVDKKGRIVATPPRSRIWHAQTPQGFPAATLQKAYTAWDGERPVTDDASLVEALGEPVFMVEGSPRNLKVTRSEDLAVAELWLRLGVP